MTTVREEMYDDLPARLHESRRRAAISTIEMARRIGVSDQTIRNWETPGSTKRPRPGDIFLWAIATGFAVEVIDPEHPQAGLRWMRALRGPDGDGGECAPRDSNPEPNDSRSAFMQPHRWVA
jgi:DNA-binding XRE family transcriptional regulator